MHHSKKQNEMEITELVALFNKLSEDAKGEDGNVDDTVLALSLGWTEKDVADFRSTFKELIDMDAFARANTPPPIKPPSDLDMLSIGVGKLDQTNPTDVDVAKAVEDANLALQKGFKAIGLTEREIDEALAMQQFNGQYFKESLDLSSCNLMRTSVRCATEQSSIQKRLEFVRKMIHEQDVKAEAAGEKGLTEEERNQRSRWVSEERQLVYQFTEIGELIKAIGQTFFDGSAKLALINMKMDERRADEAANGARIITQRRNKPSFRPAIINQQVNQETSQSAAAPP